MQEPPVHHQELDKIGAGQQHAADHRHPALLPHHGAEIPEVNLIEAQAPDDSHAALGAAVAAGAGEHGDEADEHGVGGQGVFKTVDDKAGEGGREHQQQQPGQAALHRLPNPGAQIGLVRGQDGGHALEVLGGLLLHDVHGVVHGDDAHQAVLRVHHRQGQEAVFIQGLGHVLFVVHGPGVNHVGVHDVLNDVVLLRQEQGTDGHDAQQMAAGVGDIAVVDGLLVRSGAADAFDGVGHGEILFQIHKLRGHNGPGAVLGVFQDLVDAAAGLRVRVLEDALDHRGGHLLDKVHRVVHVQLVQHLLQLRVGEGLDEQLLLLRLHLHEHLRRQLLGQQAVEQGEPVLGQLAEDQGDIRRRQGQQQVPEGGPLSLLHQFLYMADDGVAVKFHCPWASFPASLHCMVMAKRKTTALT